MKKICYIICLLPFLLNAQKLDSLFNRLVELKGEINQNIESPANIDEVRGEKCGFGLFNSVISHIDEFSKYEQNIIQKVTARPILSLSIVSPSGRFRIHYDDSGIHKPEYDVQELAIAFDSAYTFEVEYLDYPDPPADGFAGGDDKYDIYIKNQSGGLYGSTTPDSLIGNGRSTSYIEIDNSFRQNEGYATIGINAARATAAHEFHHAIQLGAYGYFENDLFYHELTSTAFEEFVFDDVNDYYAYMYSYFINTNRRLEDNSGYNLAVWNIFLKERFEQDEDYNDKPLIGHNIVKRSWELMHDYEYRAMSAISNSIQEISGKSFSQVFKEFSEWIYFTAENIINDRYFSEASNYPKVRINYNLYLGDKEKVLNFDSYPTSVSYISFINDSKIKPDTIIAVISNPDITGSLNSGNLSSIELTISQNDFYGSKSIGDLYFSKILSQPFSSVQSSYIINNELINTEVNFDGIDFVYPQPFNTKTHSLVYIPISGLGDNKVDLNIYSSDMDLVYSNTFAIGIVDKKIGWNGRDKKGEIVNSGVYFYVTKTNNKVKKGKLVILK